MGNNKKINKGKSIKAIFKADKGHLHHRIVAKGFSQKQAVFNFIWNKCNIWNICCNSIRQWNLESIIILINGNSSNRIRI